MEDKLENFLSVTGIEDEDYAIQLLLTHDLDLEASLASHFAIEDAKGHPSLGPAREEPRPRESEVVALDDEEGNHSSGTSSQAPSIPPTAATSGAVEPLNLMASRGHLSSSTSTRRHNLTSLFEAPPGLSSMLSFERASEDASSRRVWLLVNIQDAEVFASHILNRDVWGDATIGEVVRSSFVFWQRDRTHREAERYTSYYPIDAYPHVAIVDPRTGERLSCWPRNVLESGIEGIDKEQVVYRLTDFLERNDFDNSVTQRLAGARERLATTQFVGGDDDNELAQAIAASMMEGPSEGFSSADRHPLRHASRVASRLDPLLNAERDLIQQQDEEYQASLAIDRAREESQRLEEERRLREADERQQAAELKAIQQNQKRARLPQEPSVGVAGSTSIAIRLPDGTRLARRFHADDSVGSLMDFIESKTTLSEGSYDLLSPFPRVVFKDRCQTLTEAGLHRNATLIAQNRPEE